MSGGADAVVVTAPDGSAAVAPQTLLAVEVGSTYTKLVAFAENGGGLRFLGRAATRTTLDRGDVRHGVDQLIERATEFGVNGWDRAYLTSSAAGGLRIAVCGLTPTLSTKVALESALGAGGVVVFSVAGRLTGRHVARLEEARPGLVLVCGGTDHGESAAVLDNVAVLADADIAAPFLYAGNHDVRYEAQQLLERGEKTCVLADNVYPESDCFRFEQVRELIRTLFERDVVKAPGVDELARTFGTGCDPTPLAVSRAVRVMAQRLGGGLLALDVGGATTDVHSYVPAEQPGEVVRATFEPRLKRTVEGDLGVFHNLSNLLAEGEPVTGPGEPIVDSEHLRDYAFRAVTRAVDRHVGQAVRVHGSTGHREIVHGADLRRVSAVLATGGALRAALREPGDLAPVLTTVDRSRLAPERVGTWLVDRHYLMSSLGSLCPTFEAQVRGFIDEGLQEGIWS